MKQPNNTKGSILIWSIMLGLILTSVFFFFAMRQRDTIETQRDTAAILNAKAYLASYAEYLEGLEVNVIKEKVTKDKKDIKFDDITGTVTNKPKEITGVIDFEGSVTYKFSGDIYIEWNKCIDELKNYKGDLYVDTTLYQHKKTNGGCDVEDEIKKDYNDVQLVTIKDTFTLKTLNSPLHYRITAKDDKVTLKDNKWHMDLKIDLGYGKTVTVKKTFTPKPAPLPAQT